MTLFELLITFSFGGVHAESIKVLRLATTTAPETPGPLDYLLPAFEAQTGDETQAIAVGTGAALRMGRQGYADLNYQGAKSLLDWIISSESQTLIGDFKIQGERLFTPDAQSGSRRPVLEGRFIGVG